MDKVAEILESYSNMLEFVLFHIERHGLNFETEMTENAQSISVARKILLGKCEASMGFFEKLSNVVPYNSEFLSRVYTKMYQKEIKEGMCEEPENKEARKLKLKSISYLEVGRLYYEDKLSISEIARNMECNPQIIQSRIYKYEEEKNLVSNRKYRNPEITCEMCVESLIGGKSVDETAKSLSTTFSLVKSRLKTARAKYGKFYENFEATDKKALEQFVLSLKRKREPEQYNSLCITIAKLHKQGLLAEEISEQLNLPVTTIHYRVGKCKKLGLI